MFGSSTIHPIPDIANTDALLVLGANPRVSKGSFISISNMYREIMQASARGATIWFVNPRRTESSGERTGETLQIVPGTDVFLLAALIHEIDAGPGFDRCVDGRGKHVDELRAFVAGYSADTVAPIVGIDAATIRDVATTFADGSSGCGPHVDGRQHGPARDARLLARAHAQLRHREPRS